MKERFLLVIYFITLSINAQKIVVLDSLDNTPIQSVLLKDTNGKILSITDEKGEAKISQCQNITLSHISYNDKKFYPNKDKTIQKVFLSTKFYYIPEVTVSINKNENENDYQVIDSYIRITQYTDSIPTYFTEGLIKFYIPPKGSNLRYNIRSLKIYKNKNLLDKKRGAVDMAYNGLFNFIENPHFPLGKDYIKIKGEDENYHIERIIYKGKESGYIKNERNYITCFLDLLAHKESNTNSFMGSTSIIRKQQVYEIFKNKGQKNLKSGDFISYHYFSEIDSKTRKTPFVSLINTFDIYVINKSNITKKDFRKIKSSSFFGNFETSYNPSFEGFKDDRLHKLIPKVPIHIEKMIHSGKLEMY